MPVSQIASSLASVDWTVVCGGAATFITTAILTWQGIKKGREKVQEHAHIAPEGEGGGIAIKGGVLMDNYSMIMLKEQLVHTCETLQDQERCIDNNTNAQMKVWEQLVELKIEVKLLVRKLDERH